jgi:hypothetical protein
MQESSFDVVLMKVGWVILRTQVERKIFLVCESLISRAFPYHYMTLNIQKYKKWVVVQGLSMSQVIMVFVVDKVTLGQFFPKYFGYLCQSLFHQLLHSHPSSIVRGWYNRPVVAAVPSGLSLTPVRVMIKKTGCGREIHNIH